ncbi:MAG TPA: prenyltransferase/squalene oxidase repeat-containing protein, partial [Planctomycetota bacterium]|nr:prenyltransferase/squalene oxidase repeat-containing protein [Planctomycetota bacterium]
MDAMAVPTDAGAIEVHTDGDGWLSNTPWWFVSAGIHLVVLLVASLVTIERMMALEGGDVIFQLSPPSTGNVIHELVRDKDTPGQQKIPHETNQITEEKSIVFPGAEFGDHVETNNNMDDNTAQGTKLDFDSIYPGMAGGLFSSGDSKNPGLTPILGPGRGLGSGGKYGRPDRGGKKDMNAWGHPPGTPPATEDAVLAALKWLARHQNQDGSWGATSHLNHCVGAKCAGVGDSEYDAGLTGLALLAYLGAGYTHLSKDEHVDPMNPGRRLRFGEVVKSGLRWLITKQDPEGCIGGRGTKYMYNHTIAALALSEAYGMSATAYFKGPAQQAIDFIIAAQNPGRGWRYTKQSGDNDSSVTGWAIMALKSAEMSELNVPARESYEGARRWFDEATEPNGYYRTGYNARNSGKVSVPGKNENYVHHESMTAVGVLCRIFMMKDKKDPALGGIHLLVSDLPVVKPDWTDYYYWYYGSLA